MPGYRIYKTVIAVLACLLITAVFRQMSPFYMSIATIMSMRKTHGETVAYGKNRVIGTILGGILGLVVLLLIQRYELYHRYSVFILINTVAIFLCLWFGKLMHFEESAMAMACVVLLSVTINRYDINAVPYVVMRVVETLSGILIASLINRFLWIDKY